MVEQFGMDYGVKPRMVLISDMSFAEYFQKGKCVGVMFVHCPDSLGKMITEEIGFLFEVEEFADQFMESLLRWVADSSNDGDAVELEFIELHNGEYILAIAPNAERFIERMLPLMIKDRVDPVFTMVTQGKGGMTIGKNYLKFKNQYAEGRRIPVRTFVGKEGKVEKVGERYFVKTKFKFSKEGELAKDSLGRGLLAKKNKTFKPENFRQRGKVNMAPIEKRRVEELHYFYPLTLDKIERKGWLSELINTIPTHITRPEILQAICNIVLLERLKLSNPNGVKTTGPGHDFNILQHLVGTIESFESYFPPTDFFTNALIKKQVKLDKKYLLNYLEKI